MISYIVIILIIAISLYKKELGLFITTIFSPALLSISMPGVGTTFFVLSLFFFVLYIRGIGKFFCESNPFKNVIILTIIVWTVSAVFADEQHYYGLFIMLVSFTVTPICCWISFGDEKKKVLFIKTAKILCFVVVAYSVLEVLTRENPYVKLCETENVFQGHFISAVRFGIKRCQAFFSYHETLGGFCMVTGGFFLCLYLVSGEQEKNKWVYPHLASLLYITGFFTGSRSSMLAIVITLIPVLIKKRRNLVIVPLLITLVVFSMPGYFQEIINSFLNTESVSGSNSEMRAGQLELSLWYLSKANNIWIGQGFAFADNNVVGVESAMAGAESIWFRTMIDQGILGVLCISYTFIYSMYKCFRIDKKIICFPFAYLVARTVAIVPSMSLSYIFPFIMLLMLQNKKR